jgi:aspartate/methionine/tyrosine aminotransferase
MTALTHPHTESDHRHFGAGMSSTELEATLGATSDFEHRMYLYERRLRHDGNKVVNLSVAENVLLYELLDRHVFPRLRHVERKDVKYVDAHGTQELRERMAGLFREWFDADVQADHISATAGVSSALECVATALSEAGVVRPGDPVLIPAPFWQGFRWAFEQRPQLVCVPVHAEESREGEEHTFQLTLEDVKREYRSGKHRLPKLLVLTNPHNPLGYNYDKEVLEQIYEWVLAETDMHIISDEIYRHSQIDGAEPGFVSALALDAHQGGDLSPSKQRERRDRVHVVWGFAKDFGLSGFRTGFLISTSPFVTRVMRSTSDIDRQWHSLSWFSPFDSLKHRAVLSLLEAEVEEQPFTTVALKQYQSSLTSSFTRVTEALHDSGIPFVRHGNANTAQFFWLDLRKHLPKHDGRPFGGGSPFHEGELDPAEHRLWNHIKDAAGVLLLPGGTLSCPWPGYFRLCYTADTCDNVVAAVTTVGEALSAGCP